MKAIRIFPYGLYNFKKLNIISMNSNWVIKYVWMYNYIQGHSVGEGGQWDHFASGFILGTFLGSPLKIKLIRITLVIPLDLDLIYIIVIFLKYFAL